MQRKYLVVLLTILMVVVPLLAVALTPDDVPRMSKEELKSRLGRKDTVVIDVRKGYDWEKSRLKIKGAVREDPRDVASWAGKYDKKTTLVLYCA